MPRSLALFACALIAGALWVTAPALSRDPFVPRAVDFEQAVPAGALPASRARTAIVGGVTSRVIRTPRRFDLLGLRWSDAARPLVWVRVLRDGRGWSRWVRADADPDHGPDGAAPVRGSDPVWAGGADAYQVRLSRPVRGLRAHFVNSTGTATAADRVRTAMRRAAHSAVAALLTPAARAQGSGAPSIVSRDAWGADQCPPRSAPAYGRVDFGLVHHTVSANTYSASQAAGIVLAICRYHRNSNGWSDIGYNLLVDRYGQVFEGRAGGVDRAVIGSQAAGVNSYSTGVANIGDFSSSGQTPAGAEALARVLAWKLPLHGAPTQGTVAVNGRAFERISGHRDANNTACPGNALYAQLPALRARAAQLAGSGPGLTIATRAPLVRHPAATTLNGRLIGADGRAVAGAPLELQARTTAGTFVPIGTTSTDSSGGWTTSLASLRSGTYRASWVGDNGNPPAVSPALRVAVAPLISIRATSPRVMVGRRIYVIGTVRPVKARLLLVARQRSGAGYREVGRRTVFVRNGRFSVFFPPAYASIYRLQVYFTGDAANAAIGSGYAHVRTYRPPVRRR